MPLLGSCLDQTLHTKSEGQVESSDVLSQQDCQGHVVSAA